MKKNEQSHGLLGIQNTVEVRHALPCRVVLWFPVSHTYCLIRQKNVSSVIATPFCSTSVSLHVQRTHLTKRAKSYGGGIRCSSFHYKHRVFASLPRRGGSVLQGTARRLYSPPRLFRRSQPSKNRHRGGVLSHHTCDTDGVCNTPHVLYGVCHLITRSHMLWFDCALLYSAGERPSEPSPVREADFQTGQRGPKTGLRFGCGRDEARRWRGPRLPQVM